MTGIVKSAMFPLDVAFIGIVSLDAERATTLGFDYVRLDWVNASDPVGLQNQRADSGGREPNPCRRTNGRPL
jgi:hypothetical protein